MIPEENPPQTSRDWEMVILGTGLGLAVAGLMIIIAAM